MAQEVKHTPGPWRVEEGTTLIWGDCNPDDHSTRGMGYPIAEARINPSGNWSTGPYADEGEANARLIAAAPDLLDALKAAEAALASELDTRGEDYDPDYPVPCKPALNTIRAAIAKAEGRSDAVREAGVL